MSKVRYWSQQELAKDPKFRKLVLATNEQGRSLHSSRDIQKEFGGPNKVSQSTIWRASQLVLKSKKQAFTDPGQGAQKKEARQQFRNDVLMAQLSPPVDPQIVSAEEVQALKTRVILLEEQLKWAQQADPSQRSGGKMTLLLSDIHLCGRDHLIRCYEEMCQKSLIVQKQYQPEELHVVLNGDAIAGTGIYRNQYADTIVQSSTDQVKMAAYKIMVFDSMLREADPDCNVHWTIICGNHDRSMGENIAPYFSSMASNLGVKAAYGGDSQVINLASKGSYYLYAEHGYGYNKMSPSGTSWWGDMQAKLWSLSRKYYGENRIRRVTHGHTHWLQVGMERMTDLFVDTTGGCQRNERSILGKSPRPTGFIAYISPADFDGILEPITIKPDIETFDAEMDDVELFKKNMEDCSKTIADYETLAQDLGIVTAQTWEGR